MDHANDATTDPIERADSVCIRWRAWPCESCSGGSAPLDFLVRCFETSPEVPQGDRNETISWFKKWEADRLLEWIQCCEHTEWTDMSLPRLDQGSEHLVLFDEETSEVVKITLLGTYGDYYEIIDEKINQFDSTPAEYLLRMRWWERLFSSAPDPIGITEDGQIVCRQKFIVGDPRPSQETVDQFLIDAGLIAVRQNCWIWKKVGDKWDREVWIGDARSDNFILSDQGIIPIDIRVWGVPIPTKST